MAPVVKCFTCGNWYTVKETGLTICPNCQPVEDGEERLPLSYNDRKFLRALRILPED